MAHFTEAQAQSSKLESLEKSLPMVTLLIGY